MQIYMLGRAKALDELGSRSSGLLSREVAARRKKYGNNAIQAGHEDSFMHLLAGQFRNYMVWLLIFIAGFAFFAGFFLNMQEQVIDGIIISIIIFVNVLIGAYQDYKSEKAATLLKSMLKNTAIVRRDGSRLQVDSESLVPGDIVFLEEGDKVPADCRILDCSELRVDESMLTGESMHVHKSPTRQKKEAPLADRKCMLYMNTYVAGGSATCVVAATGKNTEIGRIAKSLDAQERAPFTEEVDRAGKKITYVALALITIVLAIYFTKDHQWVSVFMIGSALVIGSIPEGLPAIVTFSLAIGSLKLAKSKVIVKRKTLLETLGSVDVICTDKTGTLTENKMAVKRLFFDLRLVDRTSKLNSDTLSHFRNCALLANEAKDTVHGFTGAPEDIALVDFFNELGTDILKLRKSHPQISLEPFSSEKKYASSVNKVSGKDVRYTKGAPEVIIEKCTHVACCGSVKKLSGKTKIRVMTALRLFSDDALRNIAFSYTSKSRNILLGFVGIYDRPRKGVQKTVETIYHAGIDLKMITGDNVNTATAVAKECGFRSIKAISWEELKDYSADALRQAVEECNVFARMSPEFKVKIVSALQDNGRRVAITGDGVNDVPALKKAEVGIAMGRGTDIAKEAADLILLDDNLDSIVEGIREGRTIFSNVRKVINYLLTANLAEVFVVFFGSMLGVMPFLAIQLLWVNFVTDIIPAMALGSDPSHKDIMKKKPTGNGEKLINKRITLLTIFIGLKKVIIMFLLFLVAYNITGDLPLAQTISFTWLVLSHFVRIATIRFDEGVQLFVNKYVNWSIVVPVILQLIIIYTPVGRFFHVVALSVFDWTVILISFSIAVGLAKIITHMVDSALPASESDY